MGFVAGNLRAARHELRKFLRFFNVAMSWGAHGHNKLNDFYSLSMIGKPSAKRIMFHRLGIKIALRHMAAKRK